MHDDMLDQGQNFHISDGLKINVGLCSFTTNDVDIVSFKMLIPLSQCLKSVNLQGKRKLQMLSLGL